MNGENDSVDRSRVYLAVGLAAALAVAVIAVIVLGGSESEHEYAQAPDRCIQRWNDDPAAVAFGRHQSGAHQYFEVQILTLTPDGKGEVPSTQPGATCTVIFASSALDPEPISAAQILNRELWVPLSRFADFDRLASLQAQAQAEFNGRVTPEGTLEPL